MYVERKPSPEESQAKPRRRFMGEMDGVKVYDTTPEYTGKELTSYRGSRVFLMVCRSSRACNSKKKSRGRGKRSRGK